MANKLLLIVLYGFGIRRSKEGNAISKANPKFINSLLKSFPSTRLKAAGKYVG